MFCKKYKTTLITSKFSIPQPFLRYSFKQQPHSIFSFSWIFEFPKFISFFCSNILVPNLPLLLSWSGHSLILVRKSWFLLNHFPNEKKSPLNIWNSNHKFSRNKKIVWISVCWQTIFSYRMCGNTKFLISPSIRRPTFKHVYDQYDELV